MAMRCRKLAAVAGEPAPFLRYRVYQWARLGLCELMGFLVAWNLWMYAVVFIATIGLLVGATAGGCSRSASAGPVRSA
jgi:hypothetical protein